MVALSWKVKSFMMSVALGIALDVSRIQRISVTRKGSGMRIGWEEV
jgi:hypothetical protein